MQQKLQAPIGVGDVWVKNCWLVLEGNVLIRSFKLLQLEAVERKGGFSKRSLIALSSFMNLF